MKNQFSLLTVAPLESLPMMNKNKLINFFRQSFTESRIQKVATIATSF